MLTLEESKQVLNLLREAPKKWIYVSPKPDTYVMTDGKISLEFTLESLFRFIDK